MEYSQKENVTISEYINMIRLKTSVLVAASLGTGALVAGATEKDTSTIYNFGLNMGLAFQLQDDLLDSFGDQEVFGKKIGNDILTNKRTFLVIKAFEKAMGIDLEKLKKYYSGEVYDPLEKINDIIKIFNKLDIRKETQDQINHYHDKAIKYLIDLNVPHERKKVLIEFSDVLMKRDK